ncbi:probable serine/threonine-protein kinase DDB_G0282963 [Hyalella azteca]|uniref:Probable serine/threonine-protein kinase DDB_G0282963 n=1 Tax=Hyalella azteca TaxID=294128 RepID=A0A979FTY0_HYAAZ|nr:probable serine/threonine-protein kinase DDB_G0282963 [Hyalella azteca]
MPLLLRFMCLCSCSGGINRRPLAIIFTLEKLTNNALELYGRQTVDVRVCACPVRDYRNEEGSVPRQDRRCGRKRGGRVSSSSLLQTAISGGSSSNPVRHDFPEDMGEEVYTLQVRGKKLYDFLQLLLDSLLKPTEYQQDDDQVKFEDEALQATRDIALVEERMEMTSSSRQQTQVLYNDGPSPRYLHHNHQGNSNQRIINGHARLGNIIIHSSNNGSPVARVASKSIINSNVETCGGRVLTYSNNRDMEVMESEYIINDSDSQNSNRNSGNMITSQNNSINCNNSSFSQQQQPNRQQQMPQQIQSVTMISQEQMRDVTSMSVGTGMQVATENINNSGASNMVTHHPILSSMKNVQRATLSGSIVQNAAGNQPVLLIYNPSGVDDQLVQTFNARKILYPKMEGQGNSQNYVKSTSNNLVNLTVHADGNNCNNNNSVDYGSNNSGSQEDNIDGTYNAGLEARQNSEGASTNVALAVLKRSHSSDTEDQNGGNNGRQFRHIPISAVAQTPVRDQRKNLCVAKKMPLLKPIAGKLVAQASHQPSGTINVTLPVTSQQQHPVGSMILATQSNGGNQLFLARGSSTHIILPVTSQPQGSVDVKAMSSVFPNMSVVKREPHDEERKRDDDTNISIRKSHSVSSPYSIACSGSHISDSGNVVYTMTGNGRLVTTNLSSGNHSNNNFDSSQSNKFSSNHNMINSDGHLSGMNGHPDSAEMLAAQVLASSMGSRQIAVSGASGCTLNRDCTSD